MELGKARSTEEIIKDIKATLESKVKDNVATHGGEINFLSYEKVLYDYKWLEPVQAVP